VSQKQKIGRIPVRYAHPQHHRGDHTAGTLHVSDRPLELKRARIRGTTTVRDLAWMMNDWRE
jgi:hypothetical protein